MEMKPGAGLLLGCEIPGGEMLTVGGGGGGRGCGGAVRLGQRSTGTRNPLLLRPQKPAAQGDSLLNGLCIVLKSVYDNGVIDMQTHLIRRL